MVKQSNDMSVRYVMYACIAWLVFFYVFIAHLVELPGLLESWWTYKGLIYYRDFATFHFPIGRWVLLPFYLLTNWNLHTGPFLGLCAHIFTIVVLAHYGKCYFTRTGTVVSLVFYTLFAWYLGTGVMFYHEVFVGLLLLLSFVYFSHLSASKKNNPMASYKMGILASLTELAGQIVTPTIIVFSLLFLAAHPKKTIWYCIGLMLPLAILSLYFFANNAFDEFFQQNFLYYTTYAHSYEKVPFFQLPLKELIMFYMPAVLSIAYFLTHSRMPHRNLYLSSFALLVSTIPFIFLSVFHFHHVSFALPIASIVAGFVFSHWKSWKLSMLFVIALSIILMPWHFRSARTKNIGKVINNLSAGDTMDQTVKWVQYNTSQDASILVAGDALFYFSANRNPSNKHVYVSPYNWEPLSQITEEVNNSLPDYWVINRTFFARLLKEYKKEAMVQYLEDSLHESYTQMIVIDDWEVWKLR